MIAHSTERLIRSLGGVDVKVLSNTKDLYRYVVRRMKEARSIDDLTWGLSERERTPESQEAYEEYVSTIPTVCAKGSVMYREVMSFPAENSLKRAESLIHGGTQGYHLRYYEVASEHSPPLISFMVVDSEEVIFAFYRSGFLPTDKEIRLAVRHPEIVHLFADYYDAIWQGATRLEGSKQVMLNLIDEIKNRFPSSS